MGLFNNGWWDNTVNAFRQIGNATETVVTGTNYQDGSNINSYRGPLPMSLEAVDSAVTLGGESYDSDLDADRVAVINGPQFHYTAPEEILKVTATGAQSDRAVFNVQSYPYWSLHVIASTNVTYTVYITNVVDASDTDETDGNWIDYSSSILGAASKVGVNGFYIQNTKLPAYKVMVKAVSTTNGDTFSATVVKTF